MKLFYKPVSATPLECIQKYKASSTAYKNLKMAYAGRLDPMAHGLLILLEGGETKSRDQFQALPKTYECEFILGIETDSYDVMGLIEKVNINEIHNQKINAIIQKYVGKQHQQYPIFSSKTVRGKPLYWWIKHNKISEIEIPSKEIEIFSIKTINFDKVLAGEICKESCERINKVHGDFRQKEIIEEWNKFKNTYKNQSFKKVRISIECSSGTYIRQLIHDIGYELKTGAVANEILRTRIGDYSLNKETLVSSKALFLN